MRNLILACAILLVSLSSNAQTKVVDPVLNATQINWVSINDLPQLMAKQPRKVLIDVYTSWCGPCKMMMTNTFGNPDIIKTVNENFYAVKFNAEGNEVVNFAGNQFTNDKYDPAKANGRNSAHDFAYAIATVQTNLAYPTIVYLDEQLKILAPLQGYYQPNQMQAVLSYFKDEKFKNTDLQQYLQEALKN